MRKIYDEKGILRAEILDEFERIGNNVSCECPAHLVGLLRSVQKFTEYQNQCIKEKPSDEMIHNWLKSTSLNMEHLLSNTITNLARMEGLLDNENNLALPEDS